MPFREGGTPCERRRVNPCTYSLRQSFPSPWRRRGARRKAQTVSRKDFTRCGGLAAGIEMKTASGTVRQDLKRLGEPVFRFDDPARRTFDGTMWVWCDSGRPWATVTVTKHPSPAGGHHWLTELTSLAPGPISATIRGRCVAALRDGGPDAEVLQGAGPGSGRDEQAQADENWRDRSKPMKRTSPAAKQPSTATSFASSLARSPVRRRGIRFDRRSDVHHCVRQEPGNRDAR